MKVREFRFLAETRMSRGIYPNSAGLDGLATSFE